MWDSMARTRSSLPFIGSPCKHLPTIAATSNDARHDGAPARRGANSKGVAALPAGTGGGLRGEAGGRDAGRRQRVNRVIPALRQALPVYPEKQTISDPVRTSHECQ